MHSPHPWWHARRERSIAIDAVPIPCLLLPFRRALHLELEGNALHAEDFYVHRVAAFLCPGDLFQRLLVDLRHVNDHPTRRRQLARAQLALKVLVLLVQEQGGFVVKGTVAVVAPNVGGLLPFDGGFLLSHGRECGGLLEGREGGRGCGLGLR